MCHPSRSGSSSLERPPGSKATTGMPGSGPCCLLSPHCCGWLQGTSGNMFVSLCFKSSESMMSVSRVVFTCVWFLHVFGESAFGPTCPTQTLVDHRLIFHQYFPPKKGRSPDPPRQLARPRPFRRLPPFQEPRHAVAPALFAPALLAPARLPAAPDAGAPQARSLRGKGRPGWQGCGV